MAFSSAITCRAHVPVSFAIPRPASEEEIDGRPISLLFSERGGSGRKGAAASETLLPLSSSASSARSSPPAPPISAREPTASRLRSPLLLVSCPSRPTAARDWALAHVSSVLFHGHALAWPPRMADRPPAPTCASPCEPGLRASA